MSCLGKLSCLGKRLSKAFQKESRLYPALRFAEKYIYLKCISWLVVWTLEEILGGNKSNLSNLKTDPDLGSQTVGFIDESLCM